jgi:hypothetical protein
LGPQSLTPHFAPRAPITVWIGGGPEHNLRPVEGTRLSGNDGIFLDLYIAVLTMRCMGVGDKQGKFRPNLFLSLLEGRLLCASRPKKEVGDALTGRKTFPSGTVVAFFFRLATFIDRSVRWYNTFVQ